MKQPITSLGKIFEKKTFLVTFTMHFIGKYYLTLMTSHAVHVFNTMNYVSTLVIVLNCFCF